MMMDSPRRVPHTISTASGAGEITTTASGRSCRRDTTTNALPSALALGGGDGRANSATLLLLSHSWLSVLMAQRVRNSTMLASSRSRCRRSTLTGGCWWQGPSSSWGWGPNTLGSKGRWLVGGATETTTTTAQQHPRHGRTTTFLRYYARRGKKPARDGAAAAAGAAPAPPVVGEKTMASEPHQRQVVPHHADVAAAPQSRNDDSWTASRTASDELHRQWREYQEHERMSQVLSHHHDSLDGISDRESDDDSSSDDDASSSEAVLPATIRFPTKAADHDGDDGCSVVSDLSLPDFDKADEDEEEEEDRDDVNVVPWLGCSKDEFEGGGSEFCARVPSPGSRPSRTSVRKVKISVTGSGQVPHVRPWIVSSTRIRHHATWGMTTAEIDDDELVAWPSDEDEDDNDHVQDYLHPPIVRRGDSADTCNLKASPATTVSMSSSSFTSPTQYAAIHRRSSPSSKTFHRIAAPSLPLSPEIEPSRLFRDFRKSSPGLVASAPPSSRHPRASAHGRNRHVLVGGSAVLVNVERWQDASSSARVASTWQSSLQRTQPRICVSP